MGLFMQNTSTRQDTRTAESGNRPYFSPRRLGHVNLIVRDTDASMRFYQAVAGFEEVYRVPAIGGGFLSNGNTHHDVGMVQSSGPSGKGRPPGLNHLAFELETEVALVQGYERALQDGLGFERTLDHDIAHSAYCADPDQHSCELYADVIRDWRNARSGQVTKPKPVWWPGLTPPSAERNYESDPEFRRVPDAIFHPLRTKHACLVAADLEQSIRFYTTRIGLEVRARGANADYAMLGGTCGERSLTLVQASGALAPGYHHVGFELAGEDELEQSAAALGAAGIEPVRVVRDGLRSAIFIRDPDGLLLQFFVDHPAPETAWSDLDADRAVWLG